MSNQTTKSKSLKTNFIFYCAKAIMTVLFPIISFPYASRILNVEGIGIVQYCTSVVSYFTLIAGLGISTYAIREGVKVKNNYHLFSKLVLEIFTINVISTIFAYILLFAGIFLRFFDGYIPVLLGCSCTTLFTTLSVEWIYQAQEEYVYISIRTIVTQLISLILLFLFVRSETDTVAYSLVLSFSSGGYCLFNLFTARKYVDFKAHYNLELKKHIKNILIIFSTNIATSIYLNLDVLMIRFFSNNYQVGLYSAATKINIILRGLINSVSTVLMPRLTFYQSEKKQDQYFHLLQKGMQFAVMISISCAVGLSALSKELIMLINGKNFISASTTCQILAFNMVFSVLDNVIYTQILIPNNREKDGCNGTIVGAVSNLILNSIFIPLKGIEGAAIASLIAELAVFLYFLWIMRKTFQFRYLFCECWKPVAASLGIVLSVFIVKHIIRNYLLQIFFSIFISVIIFFGLLFILNFSLITDEWGNFKNKLSKVSK